MDALSGAVQPTFESVISYAALGLIVGFGYYLSMRTNAGLPGGAPRSLSSLLYGMRLLAAVAFFAWLASIGAVPILSAFIGFLVGRIVALRLLGEDA